MWSPQSRHFCTKHFMKVSNLWINGITVIALCLGTQGVLSQSTRPILSIRATSTNNIRLDWSTESGISYQIAYMDQLDPFGLWAPAGGPILASAGLTSVLMDMSGSPYRFFKVFSTGNGIPAATILSPANNSEVSGLITVLVGASDDSRITAVTLYVNGDPVETRTAGDMAFRLDTGHFPNGVHVLTARVADNVGIPELGGVANNATVANEAWSVPVNLTFSNTIRVLHPPILFDSFVPIDAESDVFPSAWTAIVEDQQGTVLRTIQGTTTDGIITTQWDGLDANGVAAPDEAPYLITIFLGTPPAPSAASGGGAGSPPSSPLVSTVNRYGVVEYEIETASIEIGFDRPVGVPVKSDPDPSLPPMPPMPPILERRGKELRRTISLRELMETRQRETAQPNLSGGIAQAAAAAGGSGRLNFWREKVWVSGKTLLARQQYRGTLAGPTFNATLATFLNNTATLITAAALDLPGDRSVKNVTHTVLNANNLYPALLSDLQDPDVRDFYHHGHSNGRAIGYSEFTPTAGLTQDAIGHGLFNEQLKNPNTGQTLLAFKKPFRFVFMDGCLSATGNLPEAFGIPALPPGSPAFSASNGYKPRAFMGWKTITQNSIANSDYLKFSQKFWEAWLDQDQSYNRPITVARDLAFDAAQSVTRSNLVIFGWNTLTWRQ